MDIHKQASTLMGLILQGSFILKNMSLQVMGSKLFCVWSMDPTIHSIQLGFLLIVACPVDGLLASYNMFGYVIFLIFIFLYGIWYKLVWQSSMRYNIDTSFYIFCSVMIEFSSGTMFYQL